MSPLTIGMDVLLATLLVAALALGVRLNRRLTALRDGQAGFAKAVQELNAAASRADAALSALRSATEDAHDALLSRIETARGLAQRLEKAADAADAAARRAETASGPQPSAPRILAPRPAAERPLQTTPSRRSAPPTPSAAPTVSAASNGPAVPSGAAGLRRSLDDLLQARQERLRREFPAEPDRARALSPRRRPAADEDLFEDPGFDRRRA